MSRRVQTELHPRAEPSRHSGHGWMMIACIPRLVIAAALVATGAVSPGFLLVSVGCLAMMAIMMRGMSGTSGSHH